MARLLGLDHRDRLMIVLPLAGFLARFSVAMAIATGGSIALERGFSAPIFWDRIRRRGVTQVTLPGRYVAELYARPPRRRETDHATRLVLTVGTPTEMHEGFEHRFGVSVVEAYGSADAGFIAVNPVERGRRKLGTAGLPVPWNEVAVLDDAMRPVGPSIVGQICSRPSRGKEWLSSGALGALDEEGFLTVLGPQPRCDAATLLRAS